MEHTTKRSMSLKLDYRTICVALLVIIAIMLVLWKPWQGMTSASGADRKITITGKTTIKSEPDEYVFSPMWERDTSAELTQLTADITTKLKELGVTDNQIKTNASAYDKYEPQPLIGLPEDVKTSPVQQLSLTVTTGDKDLAQKVQDYLVTTEPQGAITPYTQFSTAKQKELEDSARTAAISDAKTRAETTASGLGAKIGKVLEVGESQNASFPWASGGVEVSTMSARDSGAASYMLQPGENEFTYSIEVTYQLK